MSEPEWKAEVHRLQEGIDGHKIEFQRGCGYRWACSCGDVGQPQEMFRRVIGGAASHISGIQSGNVVQGTAALS